MARRGGTRRAPIEDKESRRWLDGAEAAAGLACVGGAWGHDGAEDVGGKLFARLAAAAEAGRMRIDVAASPGNGCGIIAVMYRGGIVETGPAAAVFAAPEHAYTRRLFEAAPGRDRDFGPPVSG